ncbi:MAG: hypothetical protein ACYTFG_16215 [Planctomycetota bacterium]|jgi:hypothetical protein
MRKFLLLGMILVVSNGCVALGYALFGRGSSESQRWRGRSQEEIWDVLQEAVNDYYDIKLAHDDDKYLESEWNQHLGPMYKSGKRFRVLAYVHWDEEFLAPYIEITVEKEINTNIDHPLKASDADWEPDYDTDGRDVSREKRIIWLVNLRLKDIKPSKRILENRPSKYSQDPGEKRREDLWGRKKKGEETEKEKPKKEKNIWK